MAAGRLSRTCPAVLRETKHNNPIILLFFIGFDELEHYGQRGGQLFFMPAHWKPLVDAFLISQEEETPKELKEKLIEM